MAAYAHNDGAPDVSQAYQDNVLVKNWYEDRFQSQVASATGRSLKDLPTSERVVHKSLRPDQAVFQTTKQATEEKFLTTPPQAKVKKPSMYTEANVAERLQTYGLADGIHYTIGPNAATEAAKPAVHNLTTTNKEFFELKPEAARAADPDTFRASGPSQFAKTGLCVKSIRGEASDDANVAGGKGARGEISRRPGESGNPYGVSVFSDEYSKWGSAIQGMPLTETRARMQTKYFP
ncbi:hypothetical protein HYH02_011567 [Chlamydomonas schloesseri]|uniref:Uncharacterized protein n=1 Tax=Chlamydomonas schloesseri TaxID=2026947 RepID=A0A835W464_9CHLO|nr:hypothetical protein HYH02_011567 [Chlamydomonas schloesseri]|eukprot:KAG2436633.1 hypothetical protein HYH02_011567 [Chlamydomonas schloesseri]